MGITLVACYCKGAVPAADCRHPGKARMPRATERKEKPVPLSKDVKDQIIASTRPTRGDTGFPECDRC